MPPRELAALLEDILMAAAAILEFTRNRTAADYESDEMLRSAVERKFTIIGEALSNALGRDPTLRNRITEARDIVDFRNVLVHGYSGIENGRVWLSIQRDLPRLLAEVRAMLSS